MSERGMMTRNVGVNGATPASASVSSRSASGSVRSDTMGSERGRIRERDLSGVGAMMGTEPVGRDKVSTERGNEKVSTEPPGVRDATLGVPPRKYNTTIPHILPHERVFPIQIGSELFRLSGASISSDAPSYFSQFFQCQLEQAREHGDTSNAVRTLYIDRDPVTFRDISLHLQGYHISPKDGEHFVRLFADAQFYSLNCLMSQLYEESIFISIGHVDFQIPRELFSDPGNSPNYFSLGFAVFFSTPNEVFPGLDREGLLRPPSILPPSVPNRSAETFSQLLHLLRGYPLEIKSAQHRAELIRDCKYFHLKGLEQKLLRHDISFNPLRKRTEITLRLDDIRQSGISVVSDPSATSAASPPETSAASTPTTPFPFATSISYINYARPFVDAQPYELLLEIGNSESKINITTLRAEFFGDTKTRISRLFEVVATKLNLPTTQPLGLLMKQGGRGSQPASPGMSGVSEDLVRVVLTNEASVVLDGREWRGDVEGNDGGVGTPSVAGLTEDWLSDQLPPVAKRRRVGGSGFVDSGSAGGGGFASNHNHGAGGFGAGFGNGGTGVGMGGGYVGGGMQNQGHNGGGGGEEWIIRTGLWRLRVQSSPPHMRGMGRGSVECVLVAVKLDAVTGEMGRNAQRGFLAF